MEPLHQVTFINDFSWVPDKLLRNLAKPFRDPELLLRDLAK